MYWSICDLHHPWIDIYKVTARGIDRTNSANMDSKDK